MKFASVLSSAVVYAPMFAVMATSQRVQGLQHSMRGRDHGGMSIEEEGRGLLEEYGFLSLSMSMPAVMPMSMSMPSELLVWAEFGMPTAAEEATSISTTPPANSSKASKKKTGVCDHRLELLQATTTIGGEYDLEEWGEEAVNKKCHYQQSSDPNFGCTIGFSPSIGDVPEKWSQGDMFFWEGRNADTYAALELYCECHLGIDRGCATKIPRIGDNEAFPGSTISSTSSTVQKWLEYCKFSGVWNGDFLLGGDFQLAKEVEECGCYFISQERSGIDSCPGLNLGEFFSFSPSFSPTFGATPSSSTPGVSE